MCNFKFIIGFIFIVNSLCFANDITWTKVFHNDSVRFDAIDNCDTLYAMAVANLDFNWGAVLKTTNAGKTWNYTLYDIDRTTAPYFAYPQDISYPSRDFCIIACDSGTFLRTQDGGKTWEEIKIDVPMVGGFLNHFFEVNMFDIHHGILVTRNHIAITHDGFNTWEILPAPGSFVIYSTDMPAPNSICVVSRDIDGSPDFNERFYRSDDGGKTWDEYPHPDYRIPRKLQFVDSLIGYEVGGKRTGIGDRQYELVFKTTDGGRSWESVLDTEVIESFGLQKLDFYDKDNGIVVGQFGSIFWTHDGGKSWYYDSSETVTENIPATMNVCYIRKDRAIVADFWGRIFISEDTTIDMIEEIRSGDDFVLYPNPATDKIKIRLKDEFINSTELQIFNSYGQEIINKSSSDLLLPTNDFLLFEVDVSTLSSGVYIAVLNGSGNVITIPFVVMR